MEILELIEFEGQSNVEIDLTPFSTFAVDVVTDIIIQDLPLYTLPGRIIGTGFNLLNHFADFAVENNPERGLFPFEK